MSKSNVLLATGDESSVLERKTFLKEEELQEIVKAKPDLINLETVFGERMMVIGREKEHIDVLGITASKVPVIIECKRRDNTDMRYLIAQVVEYAAKLAKMSYNDIDRLAVEYFQSPRCSDQGLKGLNLHAAFTKWLQDTGSDELPESSTFSDQLAENLRDGEFYLIVVVDEISDTAYQTIEFLNRKLQKLRIEIVEVKKYESGQIKVFVADHANPPGHTDTPRPGRISFEEMLGHCGQREAALIQAFRQAWESDSEWTLAMGHTGFSAQYRQNPIIWILPEYVQLAPRLRAADKFLEILKRFLPEGQKQRRLGAPGFDPSGMRDMVRMIKDVARTMYA